MTDEDDPSYCGLKPQVASRQDFDLKLEGQVNQSRIALLPFDSGIEKSESLFAKAKGWLQNRGTASTLS